MTMRQVDPEAVARSNATGTDEILSVDEVTERYYGEWVLMLVTEHDEEHWPSHGKVIAHSHNQDDLLQPIRESTAGWVDGPKMTLLSFRAYPLVRSGPEYDQAARKFFGDLMRANTRRTRSDSAAD